jgi:histidinol-phosphatase (PHP family)
MIDGHVHIETRPYLPDSIWEYAERAAEKGITELYLLEHSHRFKEFEGMYRHILIDHPEVGEYQRKWLERKMKRSITEYMALVKRMRQDTFPVKIRWGLEVCYFPGEEKMIEEITSGFSWDFLTGGIHWIDGWGFDHPQTRKSWKEKDVDAVYRRYYEIMKEMIGSGLFDIIAHPDSLKCFGYHPTADLRQTYREIGRLARQYQVKMEFNNGLHINYSYPEIGLNPVMLACFQAESVTMITASDAHHPQDVGVYIREAEAAMGREVKIGEGREVQEA